MDSSREVQLTNKRVRRPTKRKRRNSEKRGRKVEVSAKKEYADTNLMNDGKRRCWGTSDPNMRRYHDEEWGRPLNDPDRVFESMTLQIFQCGLTWKCVFRKRSGFQQAFAKFDIEKVARLDDHAFERLTQNEQIIRNKSKIKATISNAKCILAMGKHEFIKFLWQFSPLNINERLRVDSAPSGNHMRSDFKDKNYATRTRSDGVHPTETCVKLSKAMKKRGFKFMGPTVALSFMQAIGLMNHHSTDCHVFKRNEALHKAMVTALADTTLRTTTTTAYTTARAPAITTTASETTSSVPAKKSRIALVDATPLPTTTMTPTTASITTMRDNDGPTGPGSSLDHPPPRRNPLRTCNRRVSDGER